jgi:hypothetical protein
MVRAVLSLGMALWLCACAIPQKIDQVRADKARFDRQQDERAANDRCNEYSMPGTPQHLACRAAGKN